jgi:hypothetical protein
MPRCRLCQQNRKSTKTKNVGDPHVNSTLFPYSQNYEQRGVYRTSYNGNTFSDHICDECVGILYQKADKPVSGNHFTFSEEDRKYQEKLDDQESRRLAMIRGQYVQIGLVIFLILFILFLAKGTIYFWILLVLVILGLILLFSFWVMLGRAMGRALH